MLLELRILRWGCWTSGVGFNKSFTHIVTAVSFATILHHSYCIMMLNESDGYV